MANNVINIPLGQKSEEGKTAKVVIGSNTFEVSVEPENIEKIAHICVEIGNELQNVEDFEEVKKALKKAFNAVLGKGAFKKIWAESGSIIECSNVFVEISKQLAATLPKPTQAEKARHFLDHKKQKRIK